MWESYIPEAAAVMEALGIEALGEGQPATGPQQ
jgi:hypothetical protein